MEYMIIAHIPKSTDKYLLSISLLHLLSYTLLTITLLLPTTLTTHPPTLHLCTNSSPQRDPQRRVHRL